MAQKNNQCSKKGGNCIAPAKCKNEIKSISCEGNQVCCIRKKNNEKRKNVEKVAGRKKSARKNANKHLSKVKNPSKEKVFNKSRGNTIKGNKNKPRNGRKRQRGNKKLKKKQGNYILMKTKH